VVVAMYFRDPVRPHEAYPSASMRVALVVAVIAVVALGVFPGMLLDWAGGAGAAVKVAAVGS
jgi:NADH:ubiquinone oxidoreductase subunit 2 (subunit N)